MTNTDQKPSLLEIALMASVPLAAERWEREDETRRAMRLKECVDLITQHGDDLLFGGTLCTQVFIALTDAIAILSLYDHKVIFGNLIFERRQGRTIQSENSVN